LSGAVAAHARRARRRCVSVRMFSCARPRPRARRGPGVTWVRPGRQASCAWKAGP
jgi:hypothetical protein